MKYFLDSEFIEDGTTIELISIGIVAEDGREYYAISNEFNPAKASKWVEENVLSHLPAMGSRIRQKIGGDESRITRAWKPREQIKQDILAFVGDAPEFWAYFADYDWIILCQLFGTMMDLPEYFPKYCRDIKQLADDLSLYPIPIPDATPLHNALADARWAKNAWDFLSLHGNCKARTFVKELRPEVGNFAMAMELMLRNCDHKGGWHNTPLSTLKNCCLEQFYTLNQALSKRDFDQVQKQAVDMANFSMMIFSNVENIKVMDRKIG